MNTASLVVLYICVAMITISLFAVVTISLTQFRPTNFHFLYRCCIHVFVVKLLNYLLLDMSKLSQPVSSISIASARPVMSNKFDGN